MDEADKDPDKSREPSVLSENEKEYRVSIQRRMENLTLEDKDGQKRMISLQRHPTLLSNIQTAADAEVEQQRTQLEERQRLKEQWIENALKSSEETSEELERAWSVVSEKVTDPDQKKILKSQQDFCYSIIQDKYALISDLQQGLKQANKHHLKNLRRNAKEMNLMHERMKDQVKMLTTAYSEELDQTETIHQQEIKILLEKNVTEIEEGIQEFWDKELEKLMERKQKVEAAEEKICQINMKETCLKESKVQFLAFKKHKYKQDPDKIILQQKQNKQMAGTQNMKTSLARIRRRMTSLETELRWKKEEYTRIEKNFAKKESKLTEEYKRQLQKNERIQKQIKQFEVTHAKTYEDMWQMIDEELKELAERALTIDSIICKKHLGIAWERPQMANLEQTGPIQPQKLAASLSPPRSKTKKRSQGMTNASSELSLDSDSNSPATEVYKEGSTVQSESNPECEEINLFNKKQMEVLELLCDEVDLLIDPKVLKVLASQTKDKQTGVKLHLLCDVLGINEKNIPKLADFLLEYGKQHREQTEDTCAESSSMAEASFMTNSVSDLIHRDHILPALQSFLGQRRKFSFGLYPSKDLSHWERLGNIISEDKLKLWDSVERTIKQYQEALSEISDLVPEIDRLTQRNKRLRMKLEQRRKGYLEP